MSSTLRFVAFSLTVLLVTVLAAPAQATNFNQSGWWNNQSASNWTTSDERWTYPDYPIRCTAGAAEAELPAFQVIWVTRSAANDTPLPQAQGPAVNNTFQRLVSIFAASARGYGSIKDHLTPRFVGAPNANGSCVVDIKYVEAPDSVLLKGAPDPGGLWDWLEANTPHNPTTRPNRKYLSFVQWGRASEQDSIGPYVGISETGTSTPASEENRANRGLHSTVNLPTGVTKSGFLNDVDTIAHEMVHSLGGVLSAAPHSNSGGHATDGNDVMKVGVGGTQPCSADRENYRLDCNDDDYFAPYQRPLSSLYWWVSDNSFLWGRQHLLHSAVEDCINTQSPCGG